MENIFQHEPGFFQRNKVLFKGIMMGILILLMLIPTVMVHQLVNERKMRQQQIVQEVSSKWAYPQTITGPLLYVPYSSVSTDNQGKVVETKSFFWLLPEDLEVNGVINHRLRKRSIYNVLLYNAHLKSIGRFILKSPAGVDTNRVYWSEARLCYGVSDFRGIEEKIVVNLNGSDYELSPGLPNDDITAKGLSAPVDLVTAHTGTSVPFGMRVKIKGSENIRFLPLAGNSSVSLKSSWASPSFTGSVLPDERVVSDSGFTARWKFNKANLPFSTIARDLRANDLDIDFGVSLLQPADQYAKTERSVKYAILFIGLTFGLFFIVEITQKKPVHPVQYILIGLALVIFYTLLLSISEFIHFDVAYLISALAIIVMITLYAKHLFKNLRSAVLAGTIVTAQYSFIFVLIRLEDTALLVGSIGLFIVLALVMYASRKIDWYGTRELAKE